MRLVLVSIDVVMKKIFGDVGSLGVDFILIVLVDENGGIVVEINYCIYVYIFFFL